MESKNVTTALSALLATGAAIFLAMLVPAMLGLRSTALGSLFYSSFSYAALYLPSYLAVNAFLLSREKATKPNIIVLNLSFIPFVTLALLLKTALNSFDEMSYLEREIMVFFNNGAPVVLGALLALELLLLLRVSSLLSQKNDEDDEAMGSPLFSPPASTADKEPLPVKPENEPLFNLVSEPVVSEEEEKPVEKSSNQSDIRKDLEAIAYSNDDFSFLDASHEDSETLRLDGEHEFLEELHRIEKSSDLLAKPYIDIENDFKKQKKNFNDHSFLLEEDPAMNLLSQNSDYLPPHLRNTLLSPEEEAALSQVAVEIAENSQEESHMASLIDDANKSLDRALSDSDIAVKNDRVKAAYIDDLVAQKKNELAPVADDPPLPLEEASGRALDSFVDVAKEEYWEPAVVLPEEEKRQLVSLHIDDDVKEMMIGPDDDFIEEDESPFESLEESSSNYHLPVEGILDSYSSNAYWEIDDATTKAAYALESTLKEFNIEAKVIAIRKGPVVTMFELLPAPGVKLSKIENLADNIAFRLAASRVRIVAPIPGKQAVGIEIPNQQRSIVSFSELITSEQMHDPMNYIPIALGKDIEGQNQVIDLSKTPHLLIAGSTGSGKSVCVNSIICSILYTRKPRDVRLILVDPKVVELKPYNDIPHLLAPVITEPKKALQAVQWTMYEMERRYNLLDSMGAKNIRSYNKKIKEQAIAALPLPYIVLIIDEFADLIASCGKELEMSLARLAAKSRASGIHLILATQRPSADVITGLIKANFPSRIAFMVPSKVDSRIILDMGGAEQLLGKGDMLFTSSWNPFATRMQSAFLSEDEVDRVTNYVKTLGEPDYIDDEMFYDEESISSDDVMPDDDDDPLFDKALEIVIEQRKASASYLQRRLKIGYNRAARLVELMEERAIVGPANGSKPRDLLRIPI